MIRPGGFCVVFEAILGVRGFLFIALAAAALSDGICGRFVFGCGFVGGEEVSKGIFPIPGSFGNGFVTNTAFWSFLLRGALSDAEEDEAVIVVLVLAIVVAVVVVDIIACVGLVPAPVRVFVIVPVPVPTPNVLLESLFPIEVRDSDECNRFNPVFFIEWQ